MRIADSKGKTLESVYIALSDEEADELAQALTDLHSAGNGWHAHISDTTYQREITVYREDDATAAF
jgi:hypothetical protein